jgi:hypothetical protein
MPASNQALRLFGWGVESIAERGTLTVAIQITANDTITVGGVLYTFIAGATAAANQIGLGANVAAVRAAIIAAINGTDTFNTPNPLVYAPFAWGATTLVLQARAPGISSPAIGTVSSFTSGTNLFDAVTLGTTRAGANRGTLAAATSKPIVENIDFEEKDIVTRPALAKGLLLANRGNEHVSMRGTKWSVPDCPLSFEQFQNWLSMITGNYSYVAGSPNTWVFTWDPTADPAPYSWTLERRLSDGANYEQQQFGYSMMESLTIKTAQDKDAMFSAAGFARRIQTHTLTAGQTMPTPEFASSAELTVAIDALWANFGVTPILGQIYGSEITIMPGNMPLVTSPGRSDLDFGTHVINGRNVKVTAKMLMLLAPGASGQYDTEKAAAEAQTLRAVRLKLDGTSSKLIQIDALMKHGKGSMFKVSEFEGQDVVTVELEGSTDDTNFMVITVKNTSTAIG